MLETGKILKHFDQRITIREILETLLVCHELAKATGVSETFWKQGKYMALAAGLVKEHLPSIPSNFDKKDGDIVARMMKNMTSS